MSIEVTCPNGHRMKVKDHWAGRTGRCPKCLVKFAVPEKLANLSDDDALAMIGDYDPPPVKPAMVTAKTSDDQPITNPNALDEYDAQLEQATSGLSLLGSGIHREKRVCKNCGKEASQWSASCGHCGTYYDDSE